MLRALVGKSLRDWDLKLGQVEFGYNRTPSFATKHSPFEVVYGANPLMPLQLAELPKDVYVHGDAKKQAEKMIKIHEQVKRNIERANEAYKKRHNKGVVRKRFQVGDLVWVHLRKERFPEKRRNKLMPRADGPFKIVAKVSDNAYKVDLEGKHGVHATFNIGDLSPYYEDEELRTILFEEGGNEPSSSSTILLGIHEDGVSLQEEGVQLQAQRNNFAYEVHGPHNKDKGVFCLHALGVDDS